MRALRRYGFNICVIQFSRDPLHAGIIVFHWKYKEEKSDSSWSTLKQPRFLLLQFKEIKVSLNGFSGTSVLMFTSKTPNASQITCSIYKHL